MRWRHTQHFRGTRPVTPKQLGKFLSGRPPPRTPACTEDTACPVLNCKVCFIVHGIFPSKSALSSTISDGQQLLTPQKRSVCQLWPGRPGHGLCAAAPEFRVSRGHTQHSFHASHSGDRGHRGAETGSPPGTHSDAGVALGSETCILPRGPHPAQPQLGARGRAGVPGPGGQAGLFST